MKIANDTKIAFQANKMTKKQAQCLNSALLKSNGVDIICHDSTDKDAANSALLMWEYLKQKGINSRIILSQNLDALNLRNTDCNIEQANSLDTTQQNDTVLCVDFSSIGRMNLNAIDLFDRAKTQLCIDHHTKEDLFLNGDYIETKKPLKENNLPKGTSLHYIDSSAKSATSVIYRFFEALGEEIDEDRAYDIMSGLVSDCVKRGLVICDGKKGKIVPSEKFKRDKNAYEIFEHLSSILPKEKQQQIARHIDIMSNLSSEEENFYNSLFDKIQFSDDETIAYVELSPDDESWMKLGGDNGRNSTILNRFRQNVLNDENHPKINNVVVFYPVGDTYRLSIHSKDKNLLEFYAHAYSKLHNKYAMFSTGGHKLRGGGKILSQDGAECHRFALDVVKCLQECGYGMNKV